MDAWPWVKMMLHYAFDQISPQIQRVESGWALVRCLRKGWSNSRSFIFCCNHGLLGLVQAPSSTVDSGSIRTFNIFSASIRSLLVSICCSFWPCSYFIINAWSMFKSLFFMHGGLMGRTVTSQHRYRFNSWCHPASVRLACV